MLLDQFDASRPCHRVDGQFAQAERRLDQPLGEPAFQITGGNIKNIVLSAAFCAAANGGTIAMTHVLHGARREFEKIGKSWNDHYVTQGQR